MKILLKELIKEAQDLYWNHFKKLKIEKKMNLNWVWMTQFFLENYNNGNIRFFIWK